MPTIPIRWADNTAELTKNLRQGLDVIDATKASAEKMVKSLSGENLLRSAANYAAAISEIGSAQKLTASNQERVNAVMKKAVEQLEAAGRGSSDLANHYRDLAKQTEQVEKPTSRLTSWFKDFGTNAAAMATGMISAQAVIGGVSAAVRTLTGFLADSVKSAQEAEAAQGKLTQALKQQGTASDDVIKQYTDLSNAMQATTVFSDDLTTQMQALLVQVGGVMPNAMEGALQASADLAAGLGIDLQTATTLVAKAAAGHTETLGKYGISVSDAELKTKGFTAVLEAINKQFGGQAAAQVETYAGKVEQLANAWDNLKEAVGRKIIQDPIVLAAITKLTEGTTGQADATDKTGKSLSDYTGTLLRLGATVATATPGLAVFAQGFRDWAIAVENAKDAAIQFNAIAGAQKKIEQEFKGIALAAEAGAASNAAWKQGVEEGAKADAEAAKKKQALIAAIEAHTKSIQEQVAVLSGAKAAQQVKDLEEAWNELTPAQKANEESINRLRAAYEPLRKELEPSALPADLEALRAVLSSVAITGQTGLPTLVSVAAALENIRRGLTEEGLLPGAGLEDHLERVRENAAALAQAQKAGQLIPLPAVQTGLKDVVRGDETARTFAQGFGNVLRDALPKSIMAAIQGGGSILQAAGSTIGQFLTSEKGFGNAMSKGLTAVFGKGIGDAISSLLPGIGSLVGPLISKLTDVLKDAFGGPSKQELAGRQVVAGFESQFASTADMVNKVTAAYVNNGRSAAQAQAAIQRMWAAEKQGAEATKRALEEINELLKRQQEITDAIHGEGFQSQDEIMHAADIANAAYEEMLKSGKYTQEQVDQAYRHYQELLAQLEGAAGAAARAWLEAHKSADDAAKASSDAMQSAEADLKGLVDQRNALAKGIAAEAPEEVMGVIEEQQRGQLAALDKEIKDKADAYAKLADETGQKMADAIVEALKNIHIDPVHVPVVVDTPNTNSHPQSQDNFPGPSTNNDPSLPSGNDFGLPGFAGGTPNLGFADFGRGTRVILHGREAVIPIDRGEDFAARMIPTSLAPSGPIPTRLVPDRLSSGADVAAMSQTFASMVARPSAQPSSAGSGSQSEMLAVLHSIDDAIRNDRNVSVQVDGKEIVRSTHRVYDNNADGLRTDARDLLGIKA